MPNDVFIKHLENLLSEKIEIFEPVSGGDISKAYKIETSNEFFFIKINTSTNAFDMFQKEVKGLHLIKQTQTIKTPKVIAFNNFNQTTYLILEYIETKPPSTHDFRVLGEQMAKLHQCTSENFGLVTDNYIGRLKQSNSIKNNWLDFYVEERLNPQLVLATKKGLLNEKECPSISRMKDRLSLYFEDIKPSLIHGDLWSGNYLISNNGIPYLIDPAVYFGHNEVDIAMTKLFGGFDNAFYESYHSIIPQDKHTPYRIEVYQLYYLLVHLNIFGSSYYGSVNTILKKLI